MDDGHFMRRALALAREGWGQTAPNPMVGAVVVRAGEVVGEGFHPRFGGPHAERVALDAAGEAARGATLYVTLEPCVHRGKTPPCVDAVLDTGIKRVVIATRDPNPVARGGVERLRDAGVSVELGVEEEASLELNAAFFNSFRNTVPWVTLKLALSIDGAIAPRRGVARWMTGPESRRETHRLRAGVDAIAVGVGTVLADDPLLTVRDATAPRVPPSRIVFDSRLRTPVSSRLVLGARDCPLILATREPTGERAAAMLAAGVRLLPCESPSQAFELLFAEGIRSVLVEGGASLAASLLNAGLVHRFVTFQAPTFLGKDALSALEGVTPEWLARHERPRILERRMLGDDLMTVFALEEAGVHRAD